jgi:ubiquitin-protein ligase
VNAAPRESRLRADLQTLETLRQSSSVFSFEAFGDPPDRYTLSLRGKGIARSTSSAGAVEFIEVHQIDMRLPFSYPAQPPDLRWVTPLLHPNVSFSGFIHVRDLGLPWDDTVTLDVVCERLWDTARLAYVNLDRTTNFSAKNWLEGQHLIALPTDVRPLRDLVLPGGKNVVRYQRRGAPPRAHQGAAADVFFIGEDTPLPPPPARRTLDRPSRPGDDDDILYIGDE